MQPGPRLTSLMPAWRAASGGCRAALCHGQGGGGNAVALIAPVIQCSSVGTEEAGSALADCDALRYLLEFHNKTKAGLGLISSLV